jgi:hypothetical protein
MLLQAQRESEGAEVHREAPYGSVDTWGVAVEQGEDTKKKTGMRG